MEKAMNIDTPEMLLDGAIVLYSGTVVCGSASNYGCTIEIKPVVEYACFVNLQPLPKEVNVSKQLKITINFGKELKATQNNEQYQVTIPKGTAYRPDQIIGFFTNIKLGTFNIPDQIIGFFTNIKLGTFNIPKAYGHNGSVERVYWLYLNIAVQHPGILTATVIARLDGNI
jgi:hypothetical protein